MDAMTIARIRQYLDLIRFSHTLFALPFALLGAALAAHGPDGWHGRVQDWVGILLCMATARSAAMAFNRLADRRFDALNPRTAGRHLPAGLISVRLGRGLYISLFAGFRRLDALVLAEPLALVSLGPRADLAPGLFLQQAFHHPRSFLAGRLALPGPDRRMDRSARRSGMAADFSRRWRCCSGCQGSISSMPARTSISIGRRDYEACPRCLAFAALSGSRPLAMR